MRGSVFKLLGSVKWGAGMFKWCLISKRFYGDANQFPLVKRVWNAVGIGKSVSRYVHSGHTKVCVLLHFIGFFHQQVSLNVCMRDRVRRTGERTSEVRKDTERCWWWGWKGGGCVGLVINLIAKETVGTGAPHSTDYNSPSSPRNTVLSVFVVVGVHPRKLRRHWAPGIRHSLWLPVLPYLWQREFKRFIKVSIPITSHQNGHYFSPNEILPRRYKFDSESCAPTLTVVVWTAHHHPRRGWETADTFSASPQPSKPCAPYHREVSRPSPPLAPIPLNHSHVSSCITNCVAAGCCDIPITPFETLWTSLWGIADSSTGGTLFYLRPRGVFIDV